MTDSASLMHKEINHINIYNSGCEMSLERKVYP